MNKDKQILVKHGMYGKGSDCMGCHEINEYKEIYNQATYPIRFYARIAIVGMHNEKEKGETTGKRIPLNYCPVCGRKVSE
jgi:hypothetical protein